MGRDVGIVDGKKMNAIIHRWSVLLWHDFLVELNNFFICLKSVLMTKEK